MALRAHTPGTRTPEVTSLQSPALDDPKLIAEGKHRIWLDQCFAYRSLDKISGSISHSSLDCDRLKAHLVGTTSITHTRFINGAYRPQETTWTFLKLTQKLRLATTSAPVTLFSFRLPEALLETDCPLRNPAHLLLPPSIGMKRDDNLDDMSPKDPVNARIEYTIVVDFFKDGQLIKTLRKPFRVSPRHFTTPHTMNPPPSYNEIISVEEEIHRTLGGKIGSFQLTLLQPPGLLSSLEQHQITTRMPIPLEFHSTTASPPKITAIGLKLKASTHSRIEHALDSGKTDVVRAVEVRLNKLVFSRPTAPVWRAHRPGKWITDIDVPVTLCPKGYVAVPEFESCLVDRQYKLTLKFELASTGIPLSECRLTFPVWVFADEYYGIPSEAMPGQPIKTMRRYSVPVDVEAEGPGSLPGYEDTYLSNLASAVTQTPQIVGDGGTTAAPFSFHGREPDYFARPRERRSAAGAAAGDAGSSHGGLSRTLEGVEPEPESPEDEETRVPAWLVKELERPEHQSSEDPRNRDGAQ